MTYNEWKIERDRIQRKENIKIPSITRETYNSRDNKLKASGLIDFERVWLVAHKLSSAGTKEALKARKVMYQKAQDKDVSAMAYRKEISDWYKKEGWTFNNGMPNPFDMIAHYRDKINADVTLSPKVKVKPHDYKKSKALTQARKKKQMWDDTYKKTHPYKPPKPI